MMEEQAPSIPEEISELLEQRSTFRDWLEKLESRAGDVRPDVYERVRSDYVERLAGVEEELTGHRDGLEGSLAECRERVASLEEQREEKAAALEEAELRHAVGEYSDEDWDALRQESQGALAELEDRLEEGRSAARRFEEVLDDIDRSAEAPFEAATAGPAEAEEELAGGGGAEPWEPDRPDETQEPTSGFTGEIEAGVDAEQPVAGPALVEDDGGAGGDAYAADPETREHEREPGAVGGGDDVLAFLGETSGGTSPEGPVRRPEDRDEGSGELGADDGGSEPPDVEAETGMSEEMGEVGEVSGDEAFEDELDFLESLSLDDASSLDTLSLVLDEGEEDEGGGDDDEEDRGGAT